ncbi:hypothetical protein Unana1_04574 [Umbelopsis nana]
MPAAQAEHHKGLGNKYFAEHDYRHAIQEYSTAIIKDSTQVTYFTNRALCYSKLEQWDEAIQDCRRAIELDSHTVKGYYLLGNALIEKKMFTEALSSLKKAYAHATEQRVKYVGDILQALLVARKKKWDEGELARIERESEIFKYVKSLLEKERKERLAEAGEDEEKIDEVNYIQDERLSKIQKVFEQSKENRREIPDAYLDKISFNIMHDPCFTPDGITYERHSIETHFEKIGEFDPLTRRPCTKKDLIPNLSLREAIEDFLAENGWAADY